MTDSPTFPHVFVINLKHSADRRALMQERLSPLGVEFSFFDAVNGRDLDIETLPAYDKWRRRMLFGHDLTKGEIGCLLSHLGIYREILKRNLEQAIVFEDDVVLSPDFANVVRELLNMPVKWDLVRFLDSNKLFEKSRAVGPVFGRFELIRPAIVVGGGHAYLITREGARLLLQRTERYVVPIDTYHGYVWKTGLEVFSVRPSVAGQDKRIESTIEASRFEKAVQLQGWRRAIYPVTRSWLKFSDHVGKFLSYLLSWPRDIESGRRLKERLAGKAEGAAGSGR